MGCSRDILKFFCIKHEKKKYIPRWMARFKSAVLNLGYASWFLWIRRRISKTKKLPLLKKKLLFKRNSTCKLFQCLLFQVHFDIERFRQQIMVKTFKYSAKLWFDMFINKMPWILSYYTNTGKILVSRFTACRF